MDRLDKEDDVEFMDDEEVRFDMSISIGNTSFKYEDVEVEDATADEYPDMYTQSNTYEGFPFFTTKYYQAAEERLEKKTKDKVSEAGSSLRDSGVKVFEGMFELNKLRMNKLIGVLRYAE